MKLDCVLTEAFEFKLQVHRCFNCGTFWAIEKRLDFEVEIGAVVCPRCAVDEVEKVRRLLRKQDATSRALRGVISRNKKGGAL